MDSVLVIGGTRFIGRHAVTEFREAGYDVTMLNRGRHDDPFGDGVERVTGDRRDRDALETARDRVDPDAVVDCVAYFPEDVATATDVFADTEAYVYVSSGAAYGEGRVPKREDQTALEPCDDEQATTDSAATYGPRKAEGDREVFAGAENGVRAMSVRPTVVYGPHDYTERFAYWVDRVAVQDRIVVPSDGLSLWQMAYVEDVATALRTVAERGEAGEAYNVGDEHAPMLTQWVDLLAETCETGVEQIGATARDLAREGLEPQDFPMYRATPHVLSVEKIRSLGWSSTPHRVGLQRTVTEHRENDRTGRQYGPDRDTETAVIERVTE